MRLLRHAVAVQELLLVPRRGRGRQEFCVCISPEKAMIEEAEMQGRNAVRGAYELYERGVS